MAGGGEDALEFAVVGFGVVAEAEVVAGDGVSAEEGEGPLALVGDGEGLFADEEVVEEGEAAEGEEEEEGEVAAADGLEAFPAFRGEGVGGAGGAGEEPDAEGEGASAEEGAELEEGGGAVVEDGVGLEDGDFPAEVLEHPGEEGGEDEAEADGAHGEGAARRSGCAD